MYIRPSSRNCPSIDTAIDTMLGSEPRRAARMRTPCPAGTTMSGLLVAVHDSGNAGSGGSGSRLLTPQPLASKAKGRDIDGMIHRRTKLFAIGRHLAEYQSYFL